MLSEVLTGSRSQDGEEIHAVQKDNLNLHVATSSYLTLSYSFLRIQTAENFHYYGKTNEPVQFYSVFSGSGGALKRF